MISAGYLAAIILTLPFTDSLTVPVGFPIKIYEVLGALAVLGTLVGRGYKLGPHQTMLALWAAFWLGSIPAALWGYNALAEADLTLLAWANGRYHPVFNTIFHHAYLAFDIGLMALFVDAFVRQTLPMREFCRYWAMAAIIAVAYAVALNVVVAAGLPSELLLRWGGLQTMTVVGVTIVRTGPFLEGNYFGLYLLVSVVVVLWGATHWRDRVFRVAVPVIVLGTVITASPAALLGVLTVAFAALITGNTTPRVRWAAVVGAAVVAAVLVTTGLLRTIVLDKFSLLFYGGVTDVGNVSLTQRINESYRAWRMFLDHPFGVGMANYGYFVGNYPDLHPWLKTEFTMIKRIPNNVYLEVLSEHGIVLAALFMGNLIGMAVRLFRSRAFIVLVGLGVACVYFVAFSTFRLAFIWVFWAFVLAVGQARNQCADRPVGKQAAIP